ncbi:hypothetical protein HDF11_002219 [Tunturiibacter psychrotolerans]
MKCGLDKRIGSLVSNFHGKKRKSDTEILHCAQDDDLVGATDVPWSERFRFYFAYQMDSELASDSGVMNHRHKHYL